MRPCPRQIWAEVHAALPNRCRTAVYDRGRRLMQVCPLAVVCAPEGTMKALLRRCESDGSIEVLLRLRMLAEGG